MFTVLLLVGVYFLLPKLAGLNRTWGELKHGDPWMLAVAGVVELLSVGGYAVLFNTVFGRGIDRINWRTSFQITLAGIAAIRLFAAAGIGGIAVSAWALRRAGMKASVIACRMVALYVVQYSIYLGSLVICGIGLYSGLFPGGGSFALTLLPAIISAVVIAIFLAMAFVPEDFERRLEKLSRRGGRLGRCAAKAAKAPATIGSGVRTAIMLFRERRLGLLGGIAYWGFDIAALGFSFKAFNQDMPLAVLIQGYFLGTFGSVLPTPGGVGGIEAGMIGAFVAFGIPTGRAIIGVLAYRAISFWLPTLPGIVGYFRLLRTVRRWQAEDARGHTRERETAGRAGS